MGPFGPPILEKSETLICPHKHKDICPDLHQGIHPDKHQDICPDKQDIHTDKHNELNGNFILVLKFVQPSLQ